MTKKKPCDHFFKVSREIVRDASQSESINEDVFLLFHCRAELENHGVSMEQ